MKIDELNDDCGVRILSSVGLYDLIRNTRLASRKFWDWAELVLAQPHWAAKLMLKIYPECRHIDCSWPSELGCSLVHNDAVDRFKFASCLPLRSLPQLNHSNLLCRISSVSLREAFCSGQTAAWSSSLGSLLGSLDNLKAMTLVLSGEQHYTDISERPFSRLLAGATPSAFRRLEKLDVELNLRPDENICEDNDIVPIIQHDANVQDFATFVNCMHSLRDFTLPIGLFWPAQNLIAGGMLAQLSHLKLGYSRHTAKSCQDIVASVCIACENLNVFHYNCEGEVAPSKGIHNCLHDPSVLGRLAHLRDLSLGFHGCKPLTQVRGTFTVLTAELTQFKLFVHSSECLPCGTVCDWLKIAPSAKRLTYRCNFWPSGMPPEAFFDELQHLLSRGYFVRLESLNLYAGRGTNRKLFEQLSKVSTLAVGSSLRSLKVIDHSDLPLAESSAAFRNEELSCIMRALSEATNIESLTLNMKWSCENGSHVELERLLLAMRSGSVRQLTIEMRWPDTNMIDEWRIVQAIWNGGCFVRHWRNAIWNPSLPEYIQLIGTKSEAACFGFQLRSLWVHILN